MVKEEIVEIIKPKVKKAAKKAKKEVAVIPQADYELYKSCYCFKGDVTCCRWEKLGGMKTLRPHFGCGYVKELMKYAEIGNEDGPYFDDQDGKGELKQL